MELFLDANAYVPIHPKALQAMVEFNGSIGGHGHAMSISKPGRAAASVIEQSRAKIAELIGAESPSQIVFTSTCSEACSWGIHIIDKLIEEKVLENVYMSPVEHIAIKQKCREIWGSYLKELTVNSDGVILPSYDNYGERDAVICIHVQNETGVIEPIENIKTNFLFSDMAQTLGKLKLNVSSYSNLQLAIFGAYKIGGVESFFYIKNIDFWKEYGWGSRYYLDRVSTPFVSGVVATRVALEEAYRSLPERQLNIIQFRDTLEDGLRELGFKIIGEKALRAPNTTFVMTRGVNSIFLLNQLAEEGIYMGLGSACGGATGASPLLAVLGLGGNSSDFLRISQFGYYGAKEAKVVLSKIAKYCHRNSIP